MKVCFVCNEYPDGPHGGIGTVSQLLAEGLIVLGHEVKVIGVYSSLYGHIQHEIKNGVEVHRILVNQNSKFSSFYGYWKVSMKIKKWINNKSVDVIECPDSYGTLAYFANFNRPLILRAHGNNTYFANILGNYVSEKTKKYETSLYRKSDAVCAVSKYTGDKMKQLMGYDREIHIIYNGIDIGDIDEAIKGINQVNQRKCCDVVYSGTLIKKKGVYELIDAMVLLLEKGLEVSIAINGKDTINPATGVSVKTELINIIPKQFHQNFTFNGHVTRNELFSQLKNCKLAVFPSHAEAFAMAPLEAMAMSIPTVYSNQTSGNELIDDFKDGIIIEPKSSKSIADAIEYLISNPEKAEVIGKNARLKVELMFTKQIMINNTIDFYDKVYTAFHNSRTV